MIHLATSLARHLPGLTETRSDAELLAAFRSDRDELAFAELVRRHGPLVWSACRRLLPDPTDAEDAFQASFLVLVRRAHRLAGHPTLGPWLYQVAVWTARNIRRRNARILSRRLPQMPDVADPSPGTQAFDLRTDLDEALLALPEKYRSALVLCHLQGWSRREAAARLGCPEGTLSSLLARGLDRLRVKLKGFDPAQALAIGVSSVPLVLANATVKAAIGFHLASACAATSTATLLAEGVLRMFWIKKATAASFALIAVFGFGMGIGVSVHQMPGAAAGEGDGVVAGSGGELSEYQIHLERGIAETQAVIRAHETHDRALRAYLEKLNLSLKGDEKADSSRNTLIDINTTLQGLQESKRALDSAYLQLFTLNAKKALAVDESTQKKLAKLQRQVAYARAAERAALVALRLRKEDPNVLTREEENLANASQRVAHAEADLADYEVLLRKAKAENQFEVIKLKNVKAEDAVTVLHELFNGPKKDENRVRIVAEKTSNSLIIVKASPADLLTIRKLLENVIDADKPDDKNLRMRIDENGKQIQELKAQQEMLRAQEQKLLVDLLRLGKSSDLLLRPNTPPEKPLPDTIRGTVTAYKDGYVSLSIGIDAGLTPGATLDIWREEGMQLLGSVVVERVYPKEAVATFKPIDSRRAISKLSPKELPTRGDIVGKLSGALKLKASDIAAKGYLDLVLAKPSDTWAFSVREVGPGDKAVGTVYFENFEVLKRFLTRIGAEAGGPKTVYITGPADAKNETIQAILDACKAAGLHVLAQRYADKVDPKPLEPAEQK